MTPAWVDYRYAGRSVRVIDGDTALLALDLGFGVGFTASFRIVGYNAPELGTEEGAQASAYLASLLDGQTVYVETIKPAGALRERQSFARWLAKVYLYDDESYRMRDVAGLMIERGYGNRALRLEDLR